MPLSPVSINNTASAPLICMLRLALSAQLLAGRNRQLGIAPWAALVHRLSSALDFGSAHTAAVLVADLGMLVGLARGAVRVVMRAWRQPRRGVGTCPLGP